MPTLAEITVTNYKINSRVDGTEMFYDECTLNYLHYGIATKYHEILYEITSLHKYKYLQGVELKNSEYPNQNYSSEFNYLYTNNSNEKQAITLHCDLAKNDSDSLFILKFRTASHEYFKYKKTVGSHLENQDSDLWQGTGNPSRLYSNIEGGYGIFAMYQESRDTIIVIQ